MQASPQFIERAIDLAQLFSVGLLLWGVRVLMQTRDDVREIKQELFGPQGDNGLRGDVTELNDHRPTVDTRIARIADGLNETRRAAQLPERDYLRGV